MDLTRKRLVMTAAALALSIVSQAYSASPSFTVEPAALGGPAPTFAANNIAGTSSELLTFVGNTSSGGGWLDFTAFTNSSTPISPAITGLGVNYGLYATFTVSATYTGGGGGPGTLGSNYVLNTLNYSVFGDPGNNNGYNPANATTATPATVTNTAGDVLLGTGTLISGVAGINAQGGAFLNSTETFSLTPAGGTFFVSPRPFFNVAFDAFNNTGPGVTIALPNLSITNAVGTIDFAAPVPEPGTIGMLSAGLVALAMISRRRRKSM